MDLGGMQMELESLFGRRVDVVTARTQGTYSRARAAGGGACLCTRRGLELARKEA
jgi:hypothetical protein